ncbi:MAG TPA: nucleoside triphosphate pyrophosphohydrolase family protein, partial [Candidatus Paceibacterota bacterium]
YLALGLASEAGEVAGKIKKWIRRDINPTCDLLNCVDAEMGDVLWYISQWCNETGTSLSNLMKRNIEKLEARKQHNTIQGDGDNR